MTDKPDLHIEPDVTWEEGDPPAHRDGWHRVEGVSDKSHSLYTQGAGSSAYHPQKIKHDQTMRRMAEAGDHALIADAWFIEHAQEVAIVMTAHAIVLHQALEGVLVSGESQGWDNAETRTQRAQAARLLEEGPIWGGHRPGGAESVTAPLQRDVERLSGDRLRDE